MSDKQRSMPNGEQKIILDNDTIIVDNIVIEDENVYEILSGKEELERIDQFRKIVRIGARIIKDVTFTEKIDVLESKCELLTSKFEDIADEKHEDLKKMIESLEKILSINDPSSPLNLLVGLIDKDMQDKLDINNPDSPLYRFNGQIMQKLDNIDKDIAKYITKKSVIEGTTKKGGEFEDVLEIFLNKITRPHYDLVKNLSVIKGMTGKKGDFIIEINDVPYKLLVEAKAEHINFEKATRYINSAFENRGVEFAIIVYKNDPDKKIRGIQYVENSNNKIMCQFGEDGVILEIAYYIARRFLILKHKNAELRKVKSMAKSMNVVTDIDKILLRGFIDQIIGNLEVIENIRRHSDDANKKLSFDLVELKQKIRYSLFDIKALLTPKPKEIKIENKDIREKEIVGTEKDKDIIENEDSDMEDLHNSDMSEDITMVDRPKDIEQDIESAWQ